MAKGEKGPIAVPFSLPGEVVEFPEGSQSPEVITASPERVPPVCPHFTHCGGCVLQHGSDHLIADWKRQKAIQALRHAGIADAEVRYEPAYGRGRRRVSLHVRRHKGVVLAGFMQARSHSLIDIETCPVLVPELARAFVIARQIGTALAADFKPFDIQFTACIGGLDADMRGLGALTEKARFALADAFPGFGLARLSNHGEALAGGLPPRLQMGPGLVPLPPGGFLQATQEAEEKMTSAAVLALAGARHVVDLFCGVGPFALRLAIQSRVTAADADSDAIEALTRASRQTQGLKPLQAVKRDLFRMPFTVKELAPFDAAVMDPPRAGAEAQTRMIAKSSLKRVFSVGCDAASFARDAAILVDGGWKMGPVTVLDQFRYSAHLELMSLFTRQ